MEILAFPFFRDFGGDFGRVLVEKNVWSFLVEKMRSPLTEQWLKVVEGRVNHTICNM